MSRARASRRRPYSLVSPALRESCQPVTINSKPADSGSGGGFERRPTLPMVPNVFVRESAAEKGEFGAGGRFRERVYRVTSHLVS